METITLSSFVPPRLDFKVLHFLFSFHFLCIRFLMFRCVIASFITPLLYACYCWQNALAFMDGCVCGG